MTGHRHPDKRPHELPDRLLKSSSPCWSSAPGEEGVFYRIGAWRQARCCRASDAASKGGCRSGPWRALQEVVRILPKSATLSIGDFRHVAEKRQEKQRLPPLSTAGEVGPSPAADAYFTDQPALTQGFFAAIEVQTTQGFGRLARSNSDRIER